MPSPRSTNWAPLAGHAIQIFLESKGSITSCILPDPDIFAFDSILLRGMSTGRRRSGIKQKKFVTITHAHFCNTKYSVMRKNALQPNFIRPFPSVSAIQEKPVMLEKFLMQNLQVSDCNKLFSFHTGNFPIPALSRALRPRGPFFAVPRGPSCCSRLIRRFGPRGAGNLGGRVGGARLKRLWRIARGISVVKEFSCQRHGHGHDSRSMKINAHKDKTNSNLVVHVGSSQKKRKRIARIIPSPACWRSSPGVSSDTR